MIHNSILDTIGRTPVVRIQRLAPTHVTMYVKCEFFNPLASVKDRLAIAIIEHAESTGALAPGQTVVEATSGNTGIALAMVCAAKGYPFVATMVETFSVERRRIMRMLGAKVILTPAAERGTGMVRKAAELAEKNGWFLARPDTRIIVSEPEGAALLSGKPFAPHKIQGWTPDFVPAVLNRNVADRIVTVTDAEAIDNARQLARREGLFVGISSGATFAAALKVARQASAESGPGAVILAMLPDTGERYFSTAL